MPLIKDLRANFTSPGEFWRFVKDYLGGRGRQPPITDHAGLDAFLDSRASHVAQTSLFGYLRTRAGTSYPELFANDAFMVSVNIAKWQIWLSCLSDLTVYSGGLIQRRSSAPAETVGQLIHDVSNTVLKRIGAPEEAGDRFPASIISLRARLEATDWAAIPDDETCFSESPSALVTWAPIVENLKELDSEIVRNSVRFRWQEVRRDLRRHLDAEAVLASHADK